MTKRMCLAIRRLAGLMVLAGLLSLAAPASAANYPLEITQPQPNLSTVNRFYKAYPGLMYRVRLAVIGGLYPYRFSLGTAPAGMEIDPNDGTITWANPTESGSPHQVQATVLDSEGSSQSVSWTITVTTQGFRFVDAINGRTVAEGGTGTFANPWKTIVDWYEGNVYESKRAQSYVNEFLYWREGVYSLANVYTEDGTPGQDPGRLPVLSAYKPVVWLAYPGEKPIVDHGYTGALDTGPFIIFYASSANVYVDGLEFRNMKCKGIELAPDGNNQVFANLDMHDMHYGEDGKNCAFIMTGSGGGGATPSDHMVIQSSTFHHMNLASAGAMIKIYSKNKLLIEDNTLHTVTGTTDSEGIALKGGTMTRVTVRHNVVHDVPRKSIGGNMHTLVDSELLYNCIYDAANEGLDINQDGLATNLYIYRNTVLGRVQVRNTDSADGPFRFYNNIFVNDDPGTPPGSHVYHYQVTDPSRVVLVDNLTGYPADGITDSVGNLSSSHQQYLGTHGCGVVRVFDGGAMPDGGAISDGGAMPDGGAGTGHTGDGGNDGDGASTSGCGCRVTGPRNGWVGFILFAILVWRIRSRRATS